MVENIIDSELGYIFTNDADYLTSKASLVPVQNLLYIIFSKVKNQLLMENLLLMQKKQMQKRHHNRNSHKRMKRLRFQWTQRNF